MPRDPRDIGLRQPERESRRLAEAAEEARLGGYTRASAAGEAGPEGPPGDDGAKWYSGAGAPGGATGVVGDYYLRTSDGAVYEKTGASTWTEVGNIKGPEGAEGPEGPEGGGGAIEALVAESGVGFVKHGSVAGTARPTGFKIIIWLGSVAPENAGSEDLVVYESSGGLNTDFGIVTALPSGAVVGDTCTYKAEASVYWQLIYTKESETYPWNMIGGPPLYAEVTTNQTTTSESFTNLATVGPTVTLPLAGDYDVTIGARLWSTESTRAAEMSYSIGGTAASTADQIDSYAAGVASGVGPTPNAVRKRRKTGLSAVALTAKYKRAGGGTATFEGRWIEAAPVRVG